MSILLTDSPVLFLRSASLNAVSQQGETFNTATCGIVYSPDLLIVRVDPLYFRSALLMTDDDVDFWRTVSIT